MLQQGNTIQFKENDDVFVLNLDTPLKSNRLFTNYYDLQGKILRQIDPNTYYIKYKTKAGKEVEKPCHITRHKPLFRPTRNKDQN